MSDIGCMWCQRQLDVGGYLQRARMIGVVGEGQAPQLGRVLYGNSDLHCGSDVVVTSLERDLGRGERHGVGSGVAARGMVGR